MSFSLLGLPPSMLEAVANQNYTEPYPIQTEAIPAILKGKDVLGIAPTGSGKTAGYVLPILMKLSENTVTKNRHANILVLVPTRELAEQVSDVFKLFSESVPGKIKTMAVYGGVSVNVQMMKLQGINVLIATPGRLLDLIGSNAVHLSSISTLVLDEADKMLNLGFRDEMDRIFELLPKKRQNLLFSATLNEEVQKIHQLLLHDPLVIKVDADEENIDLIEQTAYLVSDSKKGPLLRYLIKLQDKKQVLVFTSSVFSANIVTGKLWKNGIDALAIHGKLSQKGRTEALAKFKSGELQVLVATDLVSRGIDIKFLPTVINYELPRSPKDYIHRIGRTGRAGSAGEAISLISPEEEAHFRIIQKKMGKWVTMVDSKNIDFRR